MPLWAWACFMLFIIAMLALDLGVFQRKNHTIGMKEAIGWCGLWITLAVSFGLLLYFTSGKTVALEYYTGYIIELCLSVDNVFVFIVIFSYFQVPPQYQHRTLFWGIIGAVIMRFIFILAGVRLLNAFDWLIYIFGLFLIYTAIKMILPRKSEMDPGKNIAVRIFRKFFPISQGYSEGHFFTYENGRKIATPLFIVLLVIETTDVAFAIDSIPAVLAITKDPFIVFTSNIFAIIGLRSLYFALRGVMTKFYYLSYGLAVILAFIGVKMLLSEFHHIDIGISLSVIGSVLAIAAIASIIHSIRHSKSDDKT